MALTSYLSRYVAHQIRQRGSSYYKEGAVEIIHGNQYEMEATVFGTDAYDVELYRQKDTVLVACTCPYFEGEEDICKHIWASLLAAEKKGYLRGKSNSDPFHLEIYVGEDLLDEDDGDGKEEDDIGPYVKTTHFSLPQGKHHLQLVSQTPNWKTTLHALRNTFHAQQIKEKGPWPETREILYFIDIPYTLRGKGLAIETAYRERKLNGAWGQLKPIPDFYCKPENLRDPEDQRIIALLLGSRDPTDWYSYSSPYYGNKIYRILPSPLQITLMELLCSTGRCFLKKNSSTPCETPLQWEAGEPWEFGVSVEKEVSAPNYIVKGYLQRGAERIDLRRSDLLVPGGLVFIEDRVFRLQDGRAFDWITLLQREKSLVVPIEEGNAFIEELMNVPILPPLSLPEELRYEEVRVVPQPRLTVASPKKRNPWESDWLQWDLSFDYDGQIIQCDDPRRGILIDDPRRFLIRDEKVEKEAFEKLRNLKFRSGCSYGYLQREVAPRNLPKAVRALLAAGWHIEAEGKMYRRAGAFHLSVTTGIDWFEVNGEVRFDDKIAKLPQLLSALKRGESLIPLDDGTFGMVPEEWLKKYGMLAGVGTIHENHLRFTRCQIGLLDALLTIQPESTCDEHFRTLRKELMSFEGIEPWDPPEGFVGTLRNYQRDGLGWFHFLERFGFGGCLADDMGLGKTVQVLAMLEERRQRRLSELSNMNRGSGKEQGIGILGPSLVVAPRSLVFNWIQEAKRFTPKLKILDHTGANRLKPGDHFENYDLIVTTYGTLRNDAIEFKDVQFDYCILDEGQMIKNASTQTAKATRLLNAHHRLVLSGTPIENHLGELWSLFEFLNPGMLGAASIFKLAGSNQRNPDPEIRELLGRALRPFILRRTKGQVARELPEKLEQTLYCELDSKQRKLYNELRDHYRYHLLPRVEKMGIHKSTIQILEALLRLRQAACHPGLIDKSRITHPSAKLEMLLPQLEQIMEEGHKALVFSQFTSFLAILRDQLDRKKTPYAYLDGQTRNRKEMVEHFQTDTNCQLFLISLKAGGLGLNLTAAEYVYLLDPWWNPAVETQAIDRTHRIGQTRKVFAYRIISKDTVEEKVLELQQTKRDLADSIINANNSSIRNLSREDLELLLS